MQPQPKKHPEWRDRVVLILLSIDATLKVLYYNLEANGRNKTVNCREGEAALKSASSSGQSRCLRDFRRFDTARLRVRSRVESKRNTRG